MPARIRARGRKESIRYPHFHFALEKRKKRGEENTTGWVGNSDADEVPGLSCTATNKVIHGRVGYIEVHDKATKKGGGKNEATNWFYYFSPNFFIVLPRTKVEVTGHNSIDAGDG